MKKLHTFVTLGVSVLALNGCGAQIVKSLDFTTENDSGHLVAGFDAKLQLGQITLPEAKFPIYNPKVPSETLGYLETNPDGTLGVHVDVTEATKLDVTDGTLLPNGSKIPITLPAGVVPIAVPVINSSSRVYIAVGSQNILAGVAITLLADRASSSADWTRTLQRTAANAFFKFSFAPDLNGTAGIFTGKKVGVGVFAVKTLGTSQSPSSMTTFANSDLDTTGVTIESLAAVNGNRPIPTTPEVFEAHTEYPSRSKMERIQNALKNARQTKLD